MRCFFLFLFIATSYASAATYIVPSSSSSTPSSITDGTATVTTSGGNITQTTGTNGTVGIYGGQLQANDKPIAIVATGTSAIVSGSNLMNIGWDGIRPKLSWGGSAPVNITVPADLASYVAASGGTLTGGLVTGGTTAPAILTATNGTINGVTIGATSPTTVKFTQLIGSNPNITVIDASAGSSIFTNGNWNTGSGAWVNASASYSGNLTMGATSLIQFGSSGVSSPDTILLRDAANTLALRNGANAQTFNVYGTYTDGSNGQWVTLTGTGSQYQLKPVGKGTGATPKLLWITLDAGNNVIDAVGSGSPESSVTAGIGSTYHRSDGGAVTSFYVKESGTSNTGWVAK